MEKYIELKKISYINIFNNFSINIPMEKLVYLSGPNNCGKTTLIRILDRQNDSKFVLYINKKEIEIRNLNSYYKTVKCIIPQENIFHKETVEEEILYYNQNLIDEKDLLKKFKLNKYNKTQINKLDIKNKIKLQLIIELLSKPKILFIDNIMSYFNNEEVIELNEILKKYIKTYKSTIVITTVNLNNTINSNYLIIFKDNKIILEGEPLEVLENDNIINKVDLDLPFMVDLSSKLKDYDLIKKIEIDKERLINLLWK